MYTPPWTLPLLMLFGVFEFEVSHMAWYLLLVTVLMFCIIWFWKIIHGPERFVWFAVALGLFFWPSLYALQLTQLTPFMFLGAVIFLYFTARPDPTWVTDLAAGVGASFLAVKPHSVYLFWPALVLWCLARRRWNILFGLALSLLVGLLVAWSFNPEIINNYLDLYRNSPPTEFENMPTIAYWLRLLTGENNFWQQYLSVFAGLIWFIFWWPKRQANATWLELYAVLIPVSIMTTIYTWSFDQVVLLPVILQTGLNCLKTKRFYVGGIWLVLMVLDLWLHVRILENYSLWRVPTILALYLWLKRQPDWETV